jgi:hypothetical protein
MNSNFEWQQQQTKQRIQKRMGDGHRHRLAKKESDSPASNAAHTAFRLPMRLVTAIFALIR